MATPSSAIPSALPMQTFPISLQSKWSIPSAQTVIIGLIGAVFIYTIILLIRGQSLFSKKITTTYFPPDQLNALGFIKIFNDCISYHRGIVEVKVMIEDDQGRRIATRYIPRIEERADIFARLPLNQDVFVRLKVTRRDHSQRDTTEVLSPLRFRADKKNGVYPLSKTASYRLSDTISYTLTEVQASPPVYTRFSYEAKTFRSMIVACQENDGHQQDQGHHIEPLHPETYRYSYRGLDGITIESNNLFHKLVKINLLSHLNNSQLKSHLFCYVGDNITKSVELKWLIKDWKAAYKQETRRRIQYRPGEENDIGNFYIQELSYTSYRCG